jgi:hypothetical protein
MMVSKADEYGTPPMFDIPAGGGPVRTDVSKTKPVHPAGYGYCPACDRRRGTDNSKQETALVQDGPHSVWKQHDVVTWSGARRPCRASGVPVCQLPPKVGTVQCACKAVV